jgi:hypothetical protein
MAVRQCSSRRKAHNPSGSSTQQCGIVGHVNPESLENTMAALRRSLRSRICKSIRDAVAVLVQLRILAAEIVFTAAAFYGLYHAFVLLTK